MRPTWTVLVLAGCSTLETESLVRHARGAERCAAGALVAVAYPADWPQVVIDLHDELTCDTAVDDTFEVQHKLKPLPWVGPTVGAVVGQAAALVAVLALQKTADRYTSYRASDAWLVLSPVGALGGAALVTALDPPRPAQTVSTEVRVVTTHERRHREDDGAAGMLTWAGGPLALVQAGRAQLPLELAARVYGRPLLLDGRPVEWSVRRTAWVPGVLPSCMRAAHARDTTDLARASHHELDGLAVDAEACGRDGWGFADQWLSAVSRAKAARPR